MRKMYECGELISSSRPFVHSISSDAKKRFCNSCCLSNELKRCNGCQNMFYCTTDCQKIDWKWHKYECGIYFKHYQQIKQLESPLEFTTGILRLSLYLQNEPDEYFSFKSLPKQPDKRRAFKDLKMHLFDMKKTVRFQEFQRLFDYFSENNFIFVTKEEFIDNCCRFFINGVKICDASATVIGCGIYLVESMFNHSCIPNSTCLTIGSKIYVRAIKSIPYDQPVTINYIFVEKDKLQRQQELLKNYFFECHCDKCQSDLEEDFNYEQLELYQLEQNHIGKYLIETTKEISSKRFQDRPEIVERYLELGIELSRMFVQIYGEYSLSNSENLCGMVRILILSTPNIDPKSIEFVNKTRRHIEITHGKDHQIYENFQQLLSSQQSMTPIHECLLPVSPCEM